MSYHTRIALLALLDSLIIVAAVYLNYIPLHPSIEVFSQQELLASAVLLLAFHHFFASRYKLYNKAWEYASVGEIISIVKAVTFSVLGVFAIQLMLGIEIYLRALYTIWTMLVIGIGGTRFAWRMYRDQFMKKQDEKERVLIIGAGQGGTLVARQLLNNPDLGLKPVAFIDDDPRKFRLQIMDIPVVGTSEDIIEMAEQYRVNKILIAIPSLSQKEINHIFEQCVKTKAKTQIMPKIEEVMLGTITVNQFRDVQVEDLLGREPIKLDIEGISEYVSHKTVLVTGAGGSIGSEICRQVCKFQPAKLVLVGHGENSIYLIDMELRKAYGEKIEIIPVIGDVQDRERMFEVLLEHRPEVVYHAAAHKHVPLMEYNPRESVKNNVFGTKNVAEAADAAAVKTFVLVSTDKAVNPTNVMGSTKRIAEMIIQQLATTSSTKFVAVRFGNVLGSRGSVIPLFKKQIKEGGPVTVTHPDMTRYFMTIPEASRLVIQAGSLARGGEIFVLDMGDPVKIVDLAKNLIRLSGYTIEEIGIRFSGLRPGEKMFEELLNEKEIFPEPIYPKIFIGKAVLDQQKEVEYLLEHFDNFSAADLKEFVISVANRKEIRLLSLAK